MGLIFGLMGIDEFWLIIMDMTYKYIFFDTD